MINDTKIFYQHYCFEKPWYNMK